LAKLLAANGLPSAIGSVELRDHVHVHGRWDRLLLATFHRPHSGWRSDMEDEPVWVYVQQAH
jgi:hypothetical protein